MTIMDIYNWPDWVAANYGWLPEGFITGIGLGIVAVLLFFLLVLIIRRRRRSRGITITGEAGDLYITANAVREFVKRVIDEFGEVNLRNAILRQTAHGYFLRISIDVAPDTEVVPLVEQIRNRIIQQAAIKVGMDKPIKVNVVVRGYSAAIERKSPSSERNVITGFPHLAGIIPPEDSDF